MEGEGGHRKVCFLFVCLFFFFLFFLAMLHGLWDLSSLTRDQTLALGREGPPGNSLLCGFVVPFPDIHEIFTQTVGILSISLLFSSGR